MASMCERERFLGTFSPFLGIGLVYMSLFLYKTYNTHSVWVGVWTILYLSLSHSLVFLLLKFLKFSVNSIWADNRVRVCVFAIHIVATVQLNGNVRIRMVLMDSFVSIRFTSLTFIPWNWGTQAIMDLLQTCYFREEILYAGCTISFLSIPRSSQYWISKYRMDYVLRGLHHLKHNWSNSN